MKTPCHEDWGEINHNDLDANWAFRQFFGKSFDQAEEIFRSNTLYYQEDLQSIPAAVFSFCAPALLSYLLSPDARGDSDGASSFLHLVIGMLKARRNVVSAETGHILVSTAGHIALKQDFYEVDVHIYGNFSDLYAQIHELAENDD